MFFIQVIVSGISVGIMYGLVGFCFTSIYNVSQVINFAQGEFFMLGAFFAFVFLTTLKLPLLAGVILIPLCTASVAWLLQRLLVVPLINRKAGIITLVIGTMAGSMLITGLVGMQTNYSWMRVPPIFGSGVTLHIAGVFIDSQSALIVVVSVVLVLAYWLILKKTLFGMAFRATGFSAEAAKLMGIRPLRMISSAFLISAVISAIGGLLLGPMTAPNANMGFALVVNGFIAAVIGGLGNPYAAVLGGIVLGVVKYIFITYMGTAFADVVAFGVFIFILVFRPGGIVGERV